MIVTKSWLNEWVDLSGISTDLLCKTLNSIGLEVDRVKSYEIPKKIVFGKVIECEKHPDADKLNVCQVDIGTSVRQIVCGASNVRAGLNVIVATNGAVMPSGLVIKPIKLRGIDSEGMICSASEVGLEDFQAGIVELDDSIGNYKLGQEVCENILLNDDLIEIELTANRGDCLSIRGVARDLSAAFDRSLISSKVEEDEARKVGIGRMLSIAYEKKLNSDLRFRVVDLSELKVPVIVQLRLAQLEEKPKDALESILIYSTHTTGVILRAYDHSFFTDKETAIAKIEFLDDKNGFASIVSNNKKASIVGISQEDESKVHEAEGVAIIEASYIPPDLISKKMSLSKIKSDTMFYRTSRGSEPELNCGLSFIINMISKNSNSSIYAGVIEVSDDYDNKLVSVTKKEIDKIIGAVIEKSKITKIMQNLGFDTSKSSADTFVISVPRFRHDIINKQDIIEEIVRLIGIDNIPSKPFILTEKNKFEDDYYKYQKRKIYRHKAAQSGFNESIHFVFDEKKVLNHYGFETTLEELELLNPIVNTLDTLRPTLCTGLLKAASNNIKNGYSSIKLFEVGSVFTPSREESLKMAMLFCGDRENESLANSGKPQKIDFAFFSQKISDIIGEFELKEYKTKHKLSHDFQTAQIFKDGEVVGEMFRVHPSVEKEFDLDVTYLCELDFSKLSYSLKTAKKISKFQASFRDLSLLIPKEMSFELIKNVIKESATQEVINFYPVDRYEDKSLEENVSLSIRFVLRSDEKTLEEEDISLAMDKILEALNTKLDITLR